MASPEVVAIDAVKSIAIPLVIFLIGHQLSLRQEKRAQLKEVGEGAAAREAEFNRRWQDIENYWTTELHAAREAEEECVDRYRALWRWAARMAEKWNRHHPEDPCELPNGNGNSNVNGGTR